MANIIRRDPNQPQVPRRAREWDLLEPMRELMRWDPFREMAQFWRGFEPGIRGLAPTFSPEFDVRETKDAFVFRADLPGIREEDLDIQVSGNRLTISGKREREQTEESDTFYCWERGHGMFSRSFSLPEGTHPDQVSAEMRDGVLTVHIPKVAEAQPKRIAIKGTKGDGGKARA